MALKKQKLLEQAGKVAEGHVSSRALAGIVAMINGRTTPPSDTLTDMIRAHGGTCEAYPTERITHILWCVSVAIPLRFRCDPVEIFCISHSNTKKNETKQR